MPDATKPRILLITRNLPPLWGGMEQVNWHLADTLSRRCAVQVIGLREASSKAPSDVVVLESPLKPLAMFLLCAQYLALRLALRWHPDVVIAGNGLTAPLAWCTATVCGAKAVAYVHGLDVAMSNPLYRRLWRPFLKRLHRVIANSRSSASLTIAAGVDPALVDVVYLGVSIPTQTATTLDAEQFRRMHGLGDGPLLLSVGRLTSRKGLREFVVDVLPRVVARRPDCMLVIIGDVPRHALHAQAQTPSSIQEAADRAGVGNHLKFLGAIVDRNLFVAAYGAAAVHVIPVQQISGDPEGFGMVAVEAAVFGVPTVAYATGGVPDAVADDGSGYLVTSGDAAAFADRVLHCLDHPPSPERIRQQLSDLIGVSSATPSWRN
jgi:phosphatidylinositol alpha-1,6-mannosyltransferase